MVNADIVLFYCIFWPSLDLHRICHPASFAKVHESGCACRWPSYLIAALMDVIGDDGVKGVGGSGVDQEYGLR